LTRSRPGTSAWRPPSCGTGAPVAVGTHRATERRHHCITQGCTALACDARTLNPRSPFLRAVVGFRHPQQVGVNGGKWGEGPLLAAAAAQDGEGPQELVGGVHRPAVCGGGDSEWWAPMVSLGAANADPGGGAGRRTPHTTPPPPPRQDRAQSCSRTEELELESLRMSGLFKLKVQLIRMGRTKDTLAFSGFLRLNIYSTIQRYIAIIILILDIRTTRG